MSRNEKFFSNQIRISPLWREGVVMKKILVVLAVAFFLVEVAPVQAQFVSFSLGGPTTQVIVLNNTSDGAPLVATIGNKSRALPYAGNRWGRSFGFSNGGDVPIFIQVCSAIQPAYRFNSAPDWAANVSKLGDLAITDDYLRSSPSESDLKTRVSEIKNTIKNQPGKKELSEELTDWFRVVTEQGISPQTSVCGSPITIPLIALHWQQWYSYGQNTVTMITVVGNRKTGYSIQNPAPYVY